MAKKNTRSTIASESLLILGGILVFVIAHASLTQAQKYSAWSAPANLGAVINSAASDQGPALSKNGLSLYFTSNRAGSIGGFDMYVSQRTSVDDAWSSPVNLGPTVNTTSDEGNPAFSRDGHYLFFQVDLACLYRADVTLCHESFRILILPLWRPPPKL